MQVCVIGTGFVGVVSAAVFASFGNTVIGLDVDEQKIAQLRKGKVPFFEPGLEELLLSQQQLGRLSFTKEYAEAIPKSQVIVIAVGTPSAPDGQADLKYVFAATTSLAPYISPDTVVVIKSTVPPGTLKKVDALIKQEFQLAHHHQPLPKFFIASAPEFLKEGSAVQDTLRPDRVVLGTNDASAERVLRELHAPFNAPVVSVAPESAQMAKYAANAYLATRITFINQIADLCERNGANVQEVIEAIGYDRRIGHHYWYPGLGYGGSCFPKDVKELAAYSRAIGESNNLFVKINELNDARIWRILDKVGQTARGWQGKHVAVLGLSFKPNTDDLREAPSTKIIPYLTSHGARITGYDPKATYQPSPQEQAAFVQKESIEATVADADVILAVVEWPEIVGFDFGNTKAQKPQWFIDARNQFDATTLRKTGYHYIGIGQTT